MAGVLSNIIPKYLADIISLTNLDFTWFDKTFMNSFFISGDRYDTFVDPHAQVQDVFF